MINTPDCEVDLEDARILDIRRDKNTIYIKFGEATVVNNASGAKSVKNLRICLKNVTKELASYYVGHNITAPHPDPSTPLDFVEVVSWENNTLSLQGYRNNEAWYVWEVKTDAIKIQS